MDKDIEKKKCIVICEKWIDLAVKREDSEKIKKIYSVLDTIDGTTIEKYRTEAKEFLAGLRQIPEVKEVKKYVEQIGENTGRGVSLFGSE